MVGAVGADDKKRKVAKADANSGHFPARAFGSTRSRQKVPLPSVAEEEDQEQMFLPIFHTKVKEFGWRHHQKQRQQQQLLLADQQQAAAVVANEQQQLAQPPPAHKQSSGQSPAGLLQPAAASNLLNQGGPISISLHPFWAFMHFRGRK